MTASAAAATMLLLAPLLGLLPHATLAPVVIVYSVGLIQPTEFRVIRSVRMMEFRWAVVACLGVLVFGTLKGIVVAIIVSMIGLASQTAHPRVYVIGRKRGADVLRPLSPEHPDDESFDGLLIVRPEGRLFFVNAQDVAEQINALVAQHKPQVVALDMSRVPDLECSALEMLMEDLLVRCGGPARESGRRGGCGFAEEAISPALEERAKFPSFLPFVSSRWAVRRRPERREPPRPRFSLRPSRRRTFPSIRSSSGPPSAT